MQKGSESRRLAQRRQLEGAVGVRTTAPGKGVGSGMAELPSHRQPRLPTGRFSTVVNRKLQAEVVFIPGNVVGSHPFCLVLLPAWSIWFRGEDSFLLLRGEAVFLL